MTKININNVNLNYEIYGSGFPVVLIHGLSDDLTYWKYLVKELKKYYKVVAMDLRGHGKSDEGNDEYTMDLLKNDVVSLCSKLNINEFHLIGFSLGGEIALKIAIENPNTVSRLIIISSFARADRYTENNLKIMYNAINDSFEEFYDTMIDYVLPDDIIEKNKLKLENIKLNQASNKNQSAIIKTLSACMYQDIFDCLKNIKNNTLIMYGEDEKIISFNNIIEVYNEIPNSEKVSFPNTKHNVLIHRNFDDAKDIILNFLEG